MSSSAVSFFGAALSRFEVVAPRPPQYCTERRGLTRQRFQTQRVQRWTLRAANEENDAEFQSKEGAEMASQLKEIAALDQLVDLLLSAKSRDELVKLVGENILALNQDFWLRMASRSDSGDAQTREKIASLSKAIMTITEALVKMTESQLDDSSELMTEILTAAADEKGHWDLPLPPKQLESLKQVCPMLLSQRDKALRKHRESLNEAFLSTAFAWIRKSAEDNIEGMIPLMQRLLQLYAAQVLQGESSDAASQFLNDLMEQDSDTWRIQIQTATEQGLLTRDNFTKYIESKLESTIELASGSYAQRVQVEFLTKLKEEGEAVFSPPSQSTEKNSEEIPEL